MSWNCLHTALMIVMMTATEFLYSAVSSDYDAHP